MLNAPSTAADQAKSAGHSPRPRDYMDDSDSSLTRKRPRLDSGDRSYRSMSADELSNTPLQPDKNTPSSATAEHRQPGSIVSTPSQTPCKVTINVRESGQSHAAPPSAETYQSTIGIPQDNQQPLPELSGALTNGHASSPDMPDVISVSSSPPQSPEIEVAEIEDIGVQSGETRWHTLGDARNIQEGLLERLPYHDHGRTFREDVVTINHCIEHGKLPE